MTVIACVTTEEARLQESEITNQCCKGHGAYCVLCLTYMVWRDYSVAQNESRFHKGLKCVYSLRL